jgi:hypothetical protein
MHVEYRIDPEQRIIFARWAGIVTHDEMMAAARTLMADPAFSPHYARIYDVREVTDAKLTRSNLIDLALFDPIYPSAKRAAVASSTSVYGMGRMFGLVTGTEEQGSFRIFSDYDEALQWVRQAKESKTHETHHG